MSDIKNHYRELFKKHGYSAKSVQWSDKSTQFKRFEVLSQVTEKIKSVIDVGCGFGDFYGYLKSRGFSGKYLGLDYVDEFIENATNAYKEKNAKFSIFDLYNDELPDGFDYIILSGVFNNKKSDNEEFMLRTIEKMYNACRKGVAFNAMSKYVDYFDDDLYYSNPMAVFDYCKKKLTRKVTIRHDYLVKENSIPFEYTMYLYK